MSRRFPPPVVGVPNSKDRYETIVGVLRGVEDETLHWEEFFSRCRDVYLNPETGEPYSESYLKRVIPTYDLLGVIDRVDDTVSLSPPAEQWPEEYDDFQTFLWHCLKRNWVLMAEFPLGLEGLSQTYDAALSLQRESGETGVSRGRIRTYLAEERGYEFNRNDIRGYPALLTQLGAFQKLDGSYHVTEDVDQYKRWFRSADIFGELESRLKREGANTDPPSDRVKRDLAKYYMYRESGGLGKETQWYRTFWKDYIRPKARSGESTDASLLTTDKYREKKNERKRAFQDVLRRHEQFESEDLQGLPADVLHRMSATDTYEEAYRIKIASGSGITRLDLEQLADVDRPPYTFPDGFNLYEWQQEAADAWFESSPASPPMSGIAQVVTGAGKTVMALEVIREWLEANPEGVTTILVPTKVLMHQWLTELVSKLNVPVTDIGWAGDGYKDGFSEGRRVVVSIVNSAVKDDYLRSELDAVDDPEHLLVADECHRYTGDVFSNVFEYPRTATLGLSATPLSQTVTQPVGPDTTERVDIEPSEADELLLEEIGGVYYTLTYHEALTRDLIPRFSINYVGFDLTPAERDTYETISRQVSETLEDVRERHGYRLDTMGGDFHQNLQRLLQDSDLRTPEIAEYFEYTSERRELVDAAATRQAITLDLLERAVEEEQKTIVFQERIKQLEDVVAPLEKRENNRKELYKQYPALKEADKGLEQLFQKAAYQPVMYHSGHSRQVWNDFAMEWFRDAGFANVMLSVKALIEGVDVPSADVGIVRVSSSSVRQRIQTLGRILRTGDDATKHSRLYVLYARDTVDENIFRRHDWESELANAEINHLIWDTESDVLEGTLREAREDEIPNPETWKPPEPPDASDLARGDVYDGPRNGYRISVDSEGRPFDKRQNKRVFILNDPVVDAAEYVHNIKGGGSIIINEAGHMLTFVRDRGAVFLGILEGGADGLEYGEDSGQLSGDAPESLDEIF